MSKRNKRPSYSSMQDAMAAREELPIINPFQQSKAGMNTDQLQFMDKYRQGFSDTLAHLPILVDLTFNRAYRLGHDAAFTLMTELNRLAE